LAATGSLNRWSWDHSGDDNELGNAKGEDSSLSHGIAVVGADRRGPETGRQAEQMERARVAREKADPEKAELAEMEKKARAEPSAQMREEIEAAQKKEKQKRQESEKSGRE
jgi:hypothetical protein